MGEACFLHLSVLGLDGLVMIVAPSRMALPSAFVVCAQYLRSQTEQIAFFIGRTPRL